MKLTFGELELGSYFIGFPTDGDNSGHGGYLQGHYLFIKTESDTGIRLSDANFSTFPESMYVIKVLA